jgi:hypothetical protein
MTGGRRSRQAWTLVELMVAMSLGSVVLIAVMSLILYSARSYAALVNYVDLDNFSRSALDEMTREIRQADGLASVPSSNSMTFAFSDPARTVTYTYDPNSRRLLRIGDGDRRVLLEECDFLEFSYFRRNPVSNTYVLYPGDQSNCKAVQMRWVCSRTIMQQAVNTESVQSARVVIRKK